MRDTRLQPVCTDHGCFRRGFTMMEVLVAIAIFAIGFVSIAAVFPVGGLLQKQTSNAMLGRQVEQNARAIVMGNPMDAGNPVAPSQLAATGLMGVIDAPAAALLNHYSLRDRVYPLDATNLGADFYWIPLVLLQEDVSTPGFVNRKDSLMFVFVLRNAQRSSWGAGSGSGYLEPNIPLADPPAPPPPHRRPDGRPGLRQVEVSSSSVDFTPPVTTRLRVANASGLRLAPGDLILTDLGSVHRIYTIVGNDLNVFGVVSPTPNAIFVAPGPRTGSPGSPAVAITTIGGEDFIQAP